MSKYNQDKNIKTEENNNKYSIEDIKSIKEFMKFIKSITEEESPFIENGPDLNFFSSIID